MVEPIALQFSISPTPMKANVRIAGEVLMDKLSTVRTVVIKRDIIGNEYRTFAMEVVAGEENLIADCSENGCTFRMDFSRVYWNSRLGTALLHFGSLLFAGRVHSYGLHYSVFIPTSLTLPT